ncbi:hypothetical protein [Flavobacterium sp. XS2P14]|uniref:hypothetical protein n=1 Tax=Flavobacterium sp. XS2P14 TaxID=3401735 RepID=UPI003AB03D38
MNFSSLKNTPPLYLYLVSIISFVLANVIRDKSLGFYYFLLLVGVIFFILGFIRRMKAK